MTCSIAFKSLISKSGLISSALFPCRFTQMVYAIIVSSFDIGSQVIANNNGTFFIGPSCLTAISNKAISGFPKPCSPR
jgi:hypothetical protein